MVLLNTLARLFELKGELNVFSIDQGTNNLISQLCEFGMQVACHSEIFARSNQLNSHPRYFGNEKLVGHVFVFRNKVFTEGVQDNMLRRANTFQEEFCIEFGVNSTRGI